jgi:hypothetical protein
MITTVATTTASSIITDTYIPSCRRLPFDDSLTPSPPLDFSDVGGFRITYHGFDSTHRNETLAKETRFLFMIESVSG